VEKVRKKRRRDEKREMRKSKAFMLGRSSKVKSDNGGIMQDIHADERNESKYLNVIVFI
jgi:hypothetical protein